MPRKPHYNIVDRLLGRVSKSYTLNCLNASCDYHEHVFVSSKFEEEPYIEGHIGIRKLKKLPACCPKCGCKNLRKSEGPPLHY